MPKPCSTRRVEDECGDFDVYVRMLQTARERLVRQGRVLLTLRSQDDAHLEP
jgi:hypothetical protein